MISLLFLHTWTPQASLLVTSTAGQRGAYGRWDVWNCHGESVDVPECLAMCGHTLYLAQPLFRSVPSLSSGFDVGGALVRPDKPTPPRFRSVVTGAGRPGGACGSRTAGGAPVGDAGAVGAARPRGP